MQISSPAVINKFIKMTSSIFSEWVISIDFSKNPNFLSKFRGRINLMLQTKRKLDQSDAFLSEMRCSAAQKETDDNQLFNSHDPIWWRKLYMFSWCFCTVFNCCTALNFSFTGVCVKLLAKSTLKYYLLLIDLTSKLVIKTCEWRKFSYDRKVQYCNSSTHLQSWMHV